MFTCVLGALGCFHNLISTETFRRALTASVDSCAEIKIECPFSGVTKSGRVWRKVPESGARSVWLSVMLLVTVTMSVIMTKEDEEQDLFDDGDDNGYEVGNVVKRNELVYTRR